ncbi:hypothetical protein GUITHDRAFT_152975, partial [Guillardia theta CCMP2712]
MALFHLRQGEAANHLGISLTALKNACKRLDIKKWPYVRQKEGRGQVSSPQNSQDAQMDIRNAVNEQLSESCSSGNESCEDVESEDSMAADPHEAESATSSTESSTPDSSTKDFSREETKISDDTNSSTAEQPDNAGFERPEVTATQRRNSLSSNIGPRDVFLKSMQVSPFSSSFIEWYVTAEEEELHRSIETSVTHRPRESV